MKNKKRKKLDSIFRSIVILIIIFSAIKVNAASYDINGASIGIYNNDVNETETEVGVSTPIILKAGLTTKRDNYIEGSYLKIFFPKEYVDGEYKPNGTNRDLLPFKISSGIVSQDYSVDKTNPDQYVIKLNYVDIKGEVSSYVPLEFQLKNFDIANGTKIPIKAIWYDADGMELIDKTLTLKVKVNDKYRVAWGGEGIYGVTYVASGEGVLNTSSNLDEVPYVKMGSDVFVAEGHNNYVNTLEASYLSPKVKVTVKLNKDPNLFYDKDDVRNKDWTYEEEADGSRILTTIIDRPVKTSSETRRNINLPLPNFYLKLANAQIDKDHNVLTTYAEALDKDGNVIPGAKGEETKGTLRYRKADLKLNLHVNNNSNTKAIAYKEENKNTLIHYNGKIEYPDNGEGTFYIKEAKLDQLDKHLYYKSFSITGNGQLNGIYENIIYGIQNDGTKVELARNLALGQKIDIDQENYMDENKTFRSFVVEFPQGVELKEKADVIRLEADSMIYVKDWDEAIKDNPSYFINGAGGFLYDKNTKKFSLENYLKVKYYAGQEPTGENGYAKKETRALVNITQNSAFSVTNLSNKQVEYNMMLGSKGEKNIFAVKSSVYQDDRMSDLENLKYYVVLPNGYDINLDQVSFTGVAGQSPLNPTGKMIRNWNGTGKVAYEFDLSNEKEFLKNKTSLTLNYGISANQATPEGDAVIDVYVSWKNNKKGQQPLMTSTTSTKEVDRYDLNQDGLTTDIIAKVEHKVKFIPPSEVMAIKTAGMDSNSTRISALDLSGYDFYYKITITNKRTDGLIRSLNLLDVLPRKNDKTILKQENRNSEFDVYLRGPITIGDTTTNPKTKGYTVEYSTDKLGSTTNLEQRLEANFVTQDYIRSNNIPWKEVTMFRINLDPGNVNIGKNASTNFIIPVKTDGSSSEYKDLHSFNTFVHASSIEDGVTFKPETYKESAPSDVYIPSQSRAEVWFSKYGSIDKQIVNGAEIKILKGEVAEISKIDSENVIDSWIVDRFMHHLKFPSSDEKVYTMIETKVPKYYKAAAPIVFRINEKEELEVKENGIWKKINDNTIRMIDEQIPEFDLFLGKEWIGALPDSTKVKLKVNVLADKYIRTPDDSNVEGRKETLVQKDVENPVDVVSSATYKTAVFDPIFNDVPSHEFDQNSLKKEIQGVPSSYYIPNNSSRHDGTLYTNIRFLIEEQEATELKDSSGNLASGITKGIKVYPVNINGESINYQVLEAIASKEKYYGRVRNVVPKQINVEKEWIGAKGKEAKFSLMYVHDVEGEKVESQYDGLDLNGNKVEPLLLNESNQWKGAFKNLPEYTSTGEKITYSLKEIEAKNYYSNIEKKSDDTYLAKNTIMYTVNFKDSPKSDLVQSVRVLDNKSINSGSVAGEPMVPNPENFIRNGISYNFVKWVYLDSKGNKVGDFTGDTIITKDMVGDDYILEVVAEWSENKIPNDKPVNTKTDDANSIIVDKNLKPELNLQDHYQYLIGYKDNTFRPENNMTREEVAIMFSRLLKERPVKGKVYKYEFTDVARDRWSITGISYMSELGIVKGYPDGTFKPKESITRAEFSAIATRFANLTSGDKTFNDITHKHWAYDLIKKAATAGWIEGYPDGSFKPEKEITRAEVVTIVNRMLNRYADAEFAEKNQDKILYFKDIKEHWAYYPIVEATNGHDFIRKANGKDETWEKINQKTFVYDK